MDDNSLKEMMAAWVDPQFFENYKRAYDEGGWVHQAFVVSAGGCLEGRPCEGKVEQLLRSVHLFSTRPIIMLHTGMVPPKAWDPTKFPRLVLLHAKPLPQEGRWRSFNFNQYRAMILARVLTGIQLEEDMFVAPGVDALFHRTEEEVSRDYSLPILPVHFLPSKGPSSGGAWWPRFCKGGGCPGQTLRWSQAHPTWTYFALPFLGKWLRHNVRDESLSAREGFSGLRVLDVPEEEDLLNVGLWEEGASKQWCKFETPDPKDFEILLEGRSDAGVCKDERFYPDGAPLVFYAAHNAVDPSYSEKIITRLHAKLREGGLPPPIIHKGQHYHNGHELSRAFPHLACII